MRLIGSSILTFMVLLFISSCFKPPDFPVTPEIVFDNIIFRKGVSTNPNTGTPDDTLILTIDFTDGDGDLGLGAEDTIPPYNDRFYFRRFNGSLQQLTFYTSPDTNFVSYKTKRTVPGYDTLPDFVSPYNCTNWDVIKDSSGKSTDTLYFQLNNNHYNIFVDFFIQQPDGSWQLFNWSQIFAYPNCQVTGYYGRFPVLAQNQSQSAPEQGKIRYAMKSVAWTLFFSIKVLKVEVSIQDRALHRSNVLTSPPFTLESIQK